MKNNFVKITALSLLITSISISGINNFYSLIVSPHVHATVLTATPVIVGVMINDNDTPLKHKRVSLFVDDRKVGVVQTNNNGVWSYKLKPAQALANGTHYAQADVKTSANNEPWAKSTYFTVDATRDIHRSGNVDATYSAINFPFDGSFINTETPVVIGSLLDSSFNPVSGETVAVKIDGSTVSNQTSDGNGVFSYMLSTALTETAHTADAHCTQSSVDLTTTNFTVDVTPPAAPVITAPTQNSTVTSSTVTVSGTTEAGATITTFMDSDPYGDICYADDSGNWSIDYDLANASHSVTAQASDEANNAGSTSNATNFTVNA